jgi:cellulose synthase/poly-beta-1,6-N-acetylglucosamine synthase-like glycosyltransferase
VILSFSRSSKAEPTQGSGLGAFFAKLFGISIEIADEHPHPAWKPSISLQLDLTQVHLERTPFVSIHVATYNEKRVIDRFLLATTSMEYDNYEVIVADDSTDETVQLLEQWKSHPKVKISHRTSREGYKGGALQQALALTDPKTEFILVFDADFIPYPDAIAQFLKYFQALSGSLQPETLKQSPIAAVQGYQWHILN